MKLNFRSYNNHTRISFDSVKDKSNAQKHGVSLSLAARIDWASARTMPDTRRDYGETRTMSNTRTLQMPTPEEDAVIARGIASDPDTYELDAAEFKRLRRVGRPRLEHPKITVTIRYDQDVIEAFKNSGPGWQTRMNAALRHALEAGCLRDRQAPQEPPHTKTA